MPGNNMVPLTTVAGQLKENRTRDGMIGHLQAASKVGAIAAIKAERVP